MIAEIKTGDAEFHFPQKTCPAPGRSSCGGKDFEGYPLRR